jgi:hypothetical protein
LDAKELRQAQPAMVRVRSRTHSAHFLRGSRYDRVRVTPIVKRLFKVGERFNVKDRCDDDLIEVTEQSRLVEAQALEG